MFKHILVPTDFAAASTRALEIALALAKPSGSRVTLLHVCEIPVYAYAEMGLSPVDLLAPVAEIAQKRLDELVAATGARHPGVSGVFKIGSAHEQVLETATELGCDLVVMGTHGRRGLVHAALGSVAERVVRMSPVPVLTVHAPNR